MVLVSFLAGFISASTLLLLHFKREKQKWKLQKIKESSIFHLVERSKDIIYYFDFYPVFKHRYTSPSVEYFLGKGMLERLYNNPDTPFEIIHPDDYNIMDNKAKGNLDYSKPIVQRLQGMDGQYKCFEEHATPIFENGKLIAIQGIMRNIDEKMALQQDLNYRISHDGLTDIYNRHYFDQMMEKYNESTNTTVGMVLCDLDELKYLNDHFGHRMGDTLIKEVAKLLNEYFEDDAVVARVGGDEFAIIIVNQDKAYIEEICQNLFAKIDQYNQTQDEFQMKLSIGFAFSESSIGQMEHLFADADARMYENKREKKEQLLIRNR